MLYDCGYVIVRDAQAHCRTMSISASYLPTSAGDRDPSHLVPELSRRARGFASWAMIRHLGRAGIAAMVARHCRLAAAMARRIADEPGVALVNPVLPNQAVLRFGADASADEGDRLTLATIARVQAPGRVLRGRRTVARALGDAPVGDRRNAAGRRLALGRCHRRGLARGV